VATYQNLLALKSSGMSLCLPLSCFSLSLLGLYMGRTWEDIGQILFTAIVVGMVTLIGTLGVYAGVNNPDGTINWTTSLPA